MCNYCESLVSFIASRSLSPTANNRGHQGHGQDAGWGGGEGSRRSEERGRETRGAEATGGGEKGQICKNGGGEGKHPAGHQGQGKSTRAANPAAAHVG